MHAQNEIQDLDKNLTILEPRRPRAGSGAPLNKSLNKNLTIWEPRRPGAGSAAPANKTLNRNATISELRRPRTNSELQMKHACMTLI